LFKRIIHFMRFHFLCLLLTTITLSTPQAATAQEAQVPFDEAGEVSVITASMEQRLNLFPNVSDFREARLFKTESDAYELVIQYEEDDQRLRERRSLTAEEVSDLRQRVSRSLAEAEYQPSVNQEGRLELLITTTYLGFSSGSLVPVALNQEGEDVYTTSVTLGIATGFFVPFLTTQNTEVTEAQATLTNYGGFQGQTHGLLLSLLVGGDEGVTPQGTAAMTLFSSLAEATVGYTQAREWGITAGTVEGMYAGGSFGTGYGLAIPALILNEDFDGEAARLFGGLGLAGAVGGTYAGYRLARSAGYSQGDVRVLSAFGTEGLLAGASVLALSGAEDRRPIVGTLMGSTALGLGLGHALVRNTDFTEFQGDIVALGGITGAALGVGVSQIADAQPESVPMIVALGAGAGLGVTYVTFADEARNSDETASLRLNVNPIGAAASALTGTPAPAVRLHATF